MRRFDIIVTTVCCALLGYFAWHAWMGPRGFHHKEERAAWAAELAGRHADLHAERVRLEDKVVLLRPESIDPDLLDELARGTLELAKPTDVVAFTAR
ncbi:septum formation initiator family protein [Aestuariivirga sp.]|jgi:cell division protein FtsB|uniref:septum formation initiator family protein n=1 Tax=Aestuariivirga sp. TaxID=2650926 RepID=UPI003785035E